MYENQEKCNKRIFKCFYVEYGIYFTCGTLYFLIFTLICTRENVNISVLLLKKHSISKVKTLNLLYKS